MQLAMGKSAVDVTAGHANEQISFVTLQAFRRKPKLSVRGVNYLKFLHYFLRLFLFHPLTSFFLSFFSFFSFFLHSSLSVLFRSFFLRCFLSFKCLLLVWLQVLPNQKNQKEWLTTGRFDVTDIIGMSGNKTLFFTAAYPLPRNMHLYK